MTGNPLSGHTAANQASMTGSGVFTDSLVDGEHITIIFRTESVFEQQVLRFAFAYGSWAAGFADSIDIDDSEIVGCRLEDGFVEIPEFEEEVLILSK